MARPYHCLQLVSSEEREQGDRHDSGHPLANGSHLLIKFMEPKRKNLLCVSTFCGRGLVLAQTRPAMQMNEVWTPSSPPDSYRPAHTGDQLRNNLQPHSVRDAILCPSQEHHSHTASEPSRAAPWENPLHTCAFWALMTSALGHQAASDAGDSSAQDTCQDDPRPEPRQHSQPTSGVLSPNQPSLGVKPRGYAAWTQPSGGAAMSHGSCGCHG